MAQLREDLDELYAEATAIYQLAGLDHADATLLAKALRVAPFATPDLPGPSTPWFRCSRIR